MSTNDYNEAIDKYGQAADALESLRRQHEDVFAELSAQQEALAEAERELKEIARREGGRVAGGWKVTVAYPKTTTYDGAYIRQHVPKAEELGVLTLTVDGKALERAVQLGQVTGAVADAAMTTSPLTPRVKIRPSAVPKTGLRLKKKSTGG